MLKSSFAVAILLLTLGVSSFDAVNVRRSFHITPSRAHTIVRSSTNRDVIVPRMNSVRVLQALMQSAGDDEWVNVYNTNKNKNNNGDDKSKESSDSKFLMTVCASDKCPDSGCEYAKSFEYNAAEGNKTVLHVTKAHANGAGLPGNSFMSLRAVPQGDAMAKNVSLSISAWQVPCGWNPESPSPSPDMSPSPMPSPSPPAAPELPALPQVEFINAFVVYEIEGEGFGWFFNGPEATPIVQMWPVTWRAPGYTPWGHDNNVMYDLVAEKNGTSGNHTNKMLFATKNEAMHDAENARRAINPEFKLVTPLYSFEYRYLIYRRSTDNVGLFGADHISSEDSTQIEKLLEKYAPNATIDYAGVVPSPEVSPHASPEPSKKKLSTGAIVGIIIGAVALIGVIAAVVVSKGGKGSNDLPPDAYQPLDPSRK